MVQRFDINIKPWEETNIHFWISLAHKSDTGKALNIKLVILSSSLVSLLALSEFILVHVHRILSLIR